MRNLSLPIVMLTVILSPSAEARGASKVFIYQLGQRYVAYPVSNVGMDVSDRSFVEFGIE